MRRVGVAAAALAALMAAGPRDGTRDASPEGSVARDGDCERRLSEMVARMRHPGTPIETKGALAEAYARDCGKPGGR